MTPFDSWYSREVAPKLPNDCPPPIAQASREAMAACWNAALDAAKAKLLRCCCGHQMIEQHKNLGRCTVSTCGCMNACSCWEVVYDSREELMPARIDEVFKDARVTP
jgi:hypothetical protein